MLEDGPWEIGLDKNMIVALTTSIAIPIAIAMAMTMTSTQAVAVTIAKPTATSTIIMASLPFEFNVFIAIFILEDDCCHSCDTSQTHQCVAHRRMVQHREKLVWARIKYPHESNTSYGTCNRQRPSQ